MTSSPVADGSLVLETDAPLTNQTGGTSAPTISSTGTEAPTEIVILTPAIEGGTQNPTIAEGATITPTIVGETIAPTTAGLTSDPSLTPGGDSTLAPTVIDGNRTLAPSVGTNATPPETVEEFLTQKLTHDGSLETPGTPQNEAFTSLSTNFPNLVYPDNSAEITQIYALSTLFFATNGTNWRMREAWPGPNPVCGQVGVTDAWFGVMCNANGFVINLDLRENDLFGDLPSEIRGLTTLGK